MPDTKKQFPEPKERLRLIQLKRWEDLYDGEHYKIFGIKDYFVDGSSQEKKLYIALNLPALISEYFADLVVGEGVKYQVEDEETQEAIEEIVDENNLNVTVYEMAISQSVFGFTTGRAIEDDDETVLIEQVPVDQYFPKFTGSISPKRNEVTLVSYLSLQNPNGKEKPYLYKQIYELKNGDATVKHELWELNKEQNEVLKQVSIKLYDQSLSSDPVSLNLDLLPVVQCNNISKPSQVYGKSDYKDIEGLLQEINDRATQISVQLIKHMNARMAVPRGTLDDKGELRAHEADLFEVGEGESEPKYITNENPQIENGFKQLDKLLMMVSAITKMPPEALGLETKGGVEKVETMRTRLFNTVRKVNRKRIYMEKELKQLMKIALLIKGIDKEKISKIKIVWDKVLPTDPNLVTTNLVSQVAGGIKSRKKAVKELQNIHDEDLETELDDIEKDSALTLPQFSNVPRVNNLDEVL